MEKSIPLKLSTINVFVLQKFPSNIRSSRIMIMSTTKISHRGYEHQVTESVVNTSILESILVCPQDTKDGLVDVQQVWAINIWPYRHDVYLISLLHHIK